MICLKKHMRIRIILALTLFASLALSQYIDWFQAHLHILPNGLVIVHSHPVEKGNAAKGRSHSHSRAELKYLHLTHFAKLFAIKFVVLFFLFILLVIENRSDINLLPVPSILPVSRRAPPSTAW